jgi:hypothetical protein
MEANSPGTGTGNSPDKAIKDAARDLPDGTYDAEVTGRVEKQGNRPDPTPIGDYRATLKPSS